MRPASRWLWLVLLGLALGVGSCLGGGPEAPIGGVMSALPGQASLSVDATVTDMRAEKRTDWSLECQADPALVEDPDGTVIRFMEYVTEGETKTILTIEGEMWIENGGSGDAPIESIIVNLQGKDKGPFETVSSVACGDPTQLCDTQGPPKVYLDNAGSGDLVLLDDSGVDVCDDLPTVAVGDTIHLVYIATFNLTPLGMDEGDHARTEVLVTFSNAGERGGSGASCPNDQDPGDYLRTIASRISGLVPPIERINQDVEFCKWISVAPDLSIVDVPDFSIDTDSRQAACVDDPPGVVSLDGTPYCCWVTASEVEGTETLFIVESTATCKRDGRTEIENTATLTGSDTQDGITGSPAICTMLITCGQGGGGGGIDPGDYCTQTQGGWGSACRGQNTGCLRDRNWDTVFPNDLVVGGGFTMTFTSAAAVEAYLPAGSTPDVLTQDHVNPLTTESGVFGGQVTALAMNVAFDAAGIGKKDPTHDACGGALLGDLYLQSGPWAGLTVGELLDLANRVLGGDTGALGGNSVSDLNDAVAAVNECFVDCDTVCGFLDCDAP